MDDNLPFETRSCRLCNGEPIALWPPVPGGGPTHHTCHPGEERTTLLKKRKTRRHVLEALRWLARQKCIPGNCGSVCLCPSCHARKALEELDPEWRP